MTCLHPKDKRDLLHGYDVTCQECGEQIGRVALFPSAILNPQEATAILASLPEDVPADQIGRAHV